MSGPNRITQHVPNFVDLGDEKPRSAEFSTLDELRAIPLECAEVLSRYAR